MPEVSSIQVLLRVVLVACVSAGAGVVCLGQDAKPAPAGGNRTEVEQPEEETYVKLVEEIARHKARSRYVPISPGEEILRDEPGGEKNPSRRWRQEALKAGRNLSRDSVVNFREKMESKRNDVRDQLEKLQDEVKEDRDRLTERRIETWEARGSQGLVGKIVVLLAPKHLYFWLASLMATGGVVVLVVHRMRHGIRRVLNGGAARRMRLSIVLCTCVIVLVMITGVVVTDSLVFGGALYQKLLVFASAEPGGNTPIDLEQGELADLKKELDGLESELKEPPKDEPEPKKGDWERIAEIHREFWIDFHVQKEFFSQRKSLLEDIKTQEAERNKEREERQDDLAKQEWVFPIVGASVTAGILVVAIVFLWNLRKKQKEIEFTCPQCLATNSLEPIGGEAGGTRNSRADRLECENMIATVNAYNEESLERCGFDSRPVYQQMPKICLPTLGIPASGKTVWLAMLYRQLNLGSFPRQIHFEKIRSKSSSELDRKVDDLLNKRLDPGATQTDRLPSPLVFNFRDNDFWGRSNLLVNMFDYSGEVTTEQNIDHPHRERALDGDGFVFLLDPTKSFEAQSNAVVEFREELRLVKGLKAGQAVRLPAAVCVSKLDHPTVVDKLRGTSFYEDLAEIDDTGESLDLAVMEKRSRLMLEFRDILWPGWNLDRQINELLGGRYLFFPMTPFGLDEMGKELSDRSALTPFGILAPLLWLLHMSGYPVLPK